MSPKSGAIDPKDLLYGGLFQMGEAITLGMPFEVWKTHLGTYRNQGTWESFRNIYRKGGVASFWSGWQPKMVEAFLKGGILLFSKDAIIRLCTTAGASEITAGVVGGFGGGVAQVVVLGPCTYLVTASVTAPKGTSILGVAANTLKTRGISGFYHGGVALMLRQGSNWASRQALTDYARNHFKKGDPKAKLSMTEECLAGIFGGMLSTWNQPFEVLRIEAQANAAKGLPPMNMVKTASLIIKESGPLGLFQGIVPRIGLCVWQTLFMVTLPYVLKQRGLM